MHKMYQKTQFVSTRSLKELVGYLPAFAVRGQIGIEWWLVDGCRQTVGLVGLGEARKENN